MISGLDSPRRGRGPVTGKANSNSSNLGVSASAEGLASDASRACLVPQTSEVVDALYCFIDLSEG